MDWALRGHRASDIRRDPAVASLGHCLCFGTRIFHILFVSLFDLDTRQLFPLDILLLPLIVGACEDNDRSNGEDDVQSDPMVMFSVLTPGQSANLYARACINVLCFIFAAACVALRVRATIDRIFLCHSIMLQGK